MSILKLLNKFSLTIVTSILFGIVVYITFEYGEPVIVPYTDWFVAIASLGMTISLFIQELRE